MSGKVACDPLLDVSGRSIVVAGAASGIGRAVAGELARRGARLVIADRDAKRLEEARAEIGGETRALAIDATSEPDADRLMGEARAAFGRLDGLVNSVGIFRIAPALELPLAEFRATLEANVTSAFILSRAAARAFGAGQGRIVHFASVSSYVANEKYAAYATSKAAMAQLVKVLAREWAPRGITVNAIGPAVIPTPLSATLTDDPAMRDAAMSVIPMRRFGAAEDLFATVLLLLADGGRYITGQTIYVDGGRTLV